MVWSSNAVAAGCLEGAYGRVTINSLGPVEAMNVQLFNLPPNREFDLFVLQVPNFPFGLSWYQGDLQTNGNGNAQQRFLGRFSIETFTVSPGSAPAPCGARGPPLPRRRNQSAVRAGSPVPPGIVWFNSAARAAGCTGEELVRTPFNGEHNAGVQALSTRNFGDRNGPLRRI